MLLSVALQDDSLKILEAVTKFLWGVLHLKGSLTIQLHNWLLMSQVLFEKLKWFLHMLINLF